MVDEVKAVTEQQEKTIILVENYINAKNTDVFLYSGAIAYTDSAAFVDLVCKNRSKHECVLLYIATPGGDPHAAYRMIKALRMRYKTVHLGVMGPCKSAGTLIAVGSHKLIMAETGELGPLDVQLTKPDELVPNSSGLDIFQALAVTTEQAFAAFEQYLLNLIEHSSGAISTKTAAEVARDLAVGLFAPITAQVDPNRLGELQRAVRIAHAYAESLGKPNVRPKGIEQLVEGYPSHGFVVDLDEAKKIFTRVELLQGPERDIAWVFRRLLRHPSREPIILDIGNTFKRPEQETNDATKPRRSGGQANLPTRNGDSEASAPRAPPGRGATDKPYPPGARRGRGPASANRVRTGRSSGKTIKMNGNGRHHRVI